MFKLIAGIVIVLALVVGFVLFNRKQSSSDAPAVVAQPTPPVVVPVDPGPPAQSQSVTLSWHQADGLKERVFTGGFAEAATLIDTAKFLGQAYTGPASLSDQADALSASYVTNVGAGSKALALFVKLGSLNSGLALYFTDEVA